MSPEEHQAWRALRKAQSVEYFKKYDSQEETNLLKYRRMFKSLYRLDSILFTLLVKYLKFSGYEDTRNDESYAMNNLQTAWWEEFDPENKAGRKN